MELSSFEFGWRLFLPICSRTIVTERYGVFTALEEDVCELGVMSKCYYWCAIYTKFFTEFIKNLERLLGRLITNV